MCCRLRDSSMSDKKSHNDRNRVLVESDLLNGQLDSRIDHYTWLASQVFKVPISLFTVLDDDLQHFKSAIGLNPFATTPRALSFCQYAVERDEMLVVEDTLEDPRFYSSQFVTGDPKIRFYVGVPVHLQGHAIGTLCIIDHRPHDFTKQQRAILEKMALGLERVLNEPSSDLLAQQVTNISKALSASESRYTSLINNLPGVTYHVDTHKDNLSESDGMHAVEQLLQSPVTLLSRQCSTVLGCSVDQVIGKPLADVIVHPEDRRRRQLLIDAAVESGESWQVVYRLHPDLNRPNRTTWISEHGIAQTDAAGMLLSVSGYLQDVTVAQQTQQKLTRLNGALATLNGIAFDEEGVLDQQFARALTVSCEFLGMDMGVISDMTVSQCRLRAVHSNHVLPFRPGDCVAIEDSVCALVMTQSDDIAVPDRSRTPYKDAPFKDLADAQSFWATGIQFDGETVGTLYFAAAEPRQTGFSEEDTLFLQMLARWLANQFEKEHSIHRLNKLAEQAPGMLFQFRRRIDGRMHFVYASSAIERIYGVKLDEVNHDASAIFEKIVPEDVPKVLATVEDSAKDLSQWYCQFRVNSTVGGSGNEVHWLEGRSMPERLVDGSTLWHGYLMDIDQRKRNELALSANELRLRALFDLCPLGIALNELDSGAFIDANPALLITHQQNVSVLQRLHLSDLVCSDHQQTLQNAWQELAAEGKYGPIDVNILRADESVYPARMQGVKVVDPDGRVLVWSLVEDISEQRRIEKMKSRFLSTVSHELRTPVTSILGALGLLVGGALGEMPPIAAKLVAVAERNSKRLSLLVNDLLDMEKLLNDKMHFDVKPHSLNDLLHDAIEINSHYGVKRYVGVTFEGVMPEVSVATDRDRFLQAFSNLVSNAIKYSPEGVDVEVFAEPGEHMVRVSVRDYGPGIPPDFRDNVFDRFAQADSTDARAQEGTGLGLAITHEIMQHLQGRVGFDSEPGEGSTFWLEVPRVDE